MKTALSIAGSDCSGGAGIQADLKTMSALGIFGMSVIVSVVAENTNRVISTQDISPTLIADQIDAVFEDIVPDAVKVGMLSSSECMQIVAQKLKQYQPKHIVIDPVMYAKNGCPLMQENAIETLIHTIVPIASLLTPNIPEAEKIANMNIQTLEDMQTAAKKIIALGAGAVLIKGGHAAGDATDLLFDGQTVYTFAQKRIATKNTHGTGCTLSSAITAYLALGEPLAKAVEKSKVYVTGAIRHALPLGKGCGPTHHFYQFYDEEGGTK
ncbi:MAG: bifunctional hydroxymethylpyrimidine kinase/phosphomethylpyrimidine kinase [Clostridiales bacterium]|nr:bifunctional hydroxymethylpyrimidine kinase/phosphomethylpyrimidine kinase [Clostridiales bacterium]